MGKQMQFVQTIRTGDDNNELQIAVRLVQLRLVPTLLRLDGGGGDIKAYYWPCLATGNIVRMIIFTYL